MGIERVVRLPSSQAPDWAEVAAKLAELGEPPTVRMIDNLPALPAEVPPADWHEVRVGLTGGMVTIRRDGPLVRCIVWSMADPRLVRSRDACSWAVAVTTGGTVEVTSGDVRTADNFRSEFLPPGG